MSLCINQSGTWRNITTQCVNQSGTWRRVATGCINQAGTWRCYGMTAPSVSISVNPTSIVQGGGSSTLSWSSSNATTLVSSNFGAGGLSGSTTVAPGSTTTYTITVRNAFAQASNSATLTVTTPTLGSSFGGGRLICRAAGVNWIVALSSSNVYRSWYLRNDAITLAQQVSGCTGWFVPSCPQFLNPGWSCRVYWDSYTRIFTAPAGPTFTQYWTTTDNGNISNAIRVEMDSGFTGLSSKTQSWFVRAFRCVTY